MDALIEFTRNAMTKRNRMRSIPPKMIHTATIKFTSSGIVQSSDLCDELNRYMTHSDADEGSFQVVDITIDDQDPLDSM